MDYKQKSRVPVWKVTKGPYDFREISHNAPCRDKLFPGLCTVLALIVFCIEMKRKARERRRLA